MSKPIRIASQQEVTSMKEGVKVTNIMADGSICEDLSTYLDNHELPEDAKSLIVDFIRAGRKSREAQGG